jgi:hypothetical protein
MLRGRALGLALGLAAVGAVPATSGGTISDYKLIVLDGASLKWGEPVDGTPATVTYALADSVRHFPDAINCGGLAPLDQLLDANHVSPASFADELHAALAAWSAIADIDFVPAKDSASAEILIGAETEPRGRAFTNVDYDKSRRASVWGGPPPPHQLRQSLICLNPAEHWKVGFDGNLAVYDLRYTLQHEIGHAIGLDHPSAEGELMNFRYIEQFRTPQAGDIRGAVALYGPRSEDGVAVATSLAPAKPPPVASAPSALAISPPAETYPLSK